MQAQTQCKLLPCSSYRRTVCVFGAGGCRHVICSGASNVVCAWRVDCRQHTGRQVRTCGEVDGRKQRRHCSATAATGEHWPHREVTSLQAATIPAQAGAPSSHQALTAAEDGASAFAQGGHVGGAGRPDGRCHCISCGGRVRATPAEEALLAVDAGVSSRILARRTGCLQTTGANGCRARAVRARWWGPLECGQVGRSAAVWHPIMPLQMHHIVSYEAAWQSGC